MLLDFRGKHIHYRDTGKGGAIVLLHGFMESSEIWNGFADRLSGQFRVITPDLPGHGLSDCLDKVHTMDLMAEAVRSLLDNLGITECIMIGHSMGGYATLAFAEHYPRYLRGVGLFHSQAAADTPEAKANRDRTVAVIRQNHGGFVSQFIPDLFYEANREKLRTVINALIETSLRISPPGMIAAVEGMKSRPDRISMLQKLEVPVMFIFGKSDPRISLEAGMLQASLPRHAEVLVLEGVAHMGYAEEAETTFRFLESFALRTLWPDFAN